MNINKYHFIIVAVALFSISGLWYVSTIIDSGKKIETSFSEPETTYSYDFETETDTEEMKEIKVYITGEVKKQGVYSASENDRICDIVDMAGGFTDKADIESVNMAEHIKDEQHIIIGNVDEHIDKSENSIQNNKKDNLIDINTADKDELKKLSGIGDVLAQNIIDYRENNGPFKTIDEIKNVSRIGSKLFEKLKSHIKVS